MQNTPHAADAHKDMGAEAVIARAIARRGEIFDEFRLLAKESPHTYDLISKTAGLICPNIRFPDQLGPFGGFGFRECAEVIGRTAYWFSAEFQ